MSHDFLSNFEPIDKMQPEAESEETSSAVVERLYFAATDHVRNLCFVWPEGHRKFLGYYRLEGGELNEDCTFIKLFFGSQQVELLGLNLLPLFDALMAHERRLIYCDDPRYNDLAEGEIVVNDVMISDI